MRSYKSGYITGPYGNTLYGAPRVRGTHRQHRHLQARRMRKAAIRSPAVGAGYGSFGFKGIGLLGLLGAGVLGYSLLSKRSLGFKRSFGFNRSLIGTGVATTGIATGISPIASTGIATTGLASTGVSRVSPTMKERMGFTGHYPKLGIMGLVKGIKNKALYGTPYMIKEPVVPVNSFRQVW